MVRCHEGEVREIDGSWVRKDGMVPLSKKFYNAQYAINKQQFAQWSREGDDGNDLPQLPDHTQDPEGRYCTILAAGEPAFGGFRVRTARVIALAELFWFFGPKYTARELYAYYVKARRLVLTRPHPEASEERRQQVHAHRETTGRYGLGSARPGELVHD